MIILRLMATLEAHCAETEEALGQPYTEVHRWLDQFHIDGTLGARHRRKRHHEKGIQEVIKLFGEEAGVAARMHIVTDLKGEGWTESDRFPKDEKEYVEMGLF